MKILFGGAAKEREQIIVLCLVPPQTLVRFIILSQPANQPFRFFNCVKMGKYNKTPFFLEGK